MTRRKIAFYCVANHLGGAERSLVDLLGKLRHDPGLELTVILPRAEGKLGDAVAVMGIRTVVLPMPGTLLSLSRGAPLRSAALFAAGIPAFVAYIARLRALLLRERPHVVHTTGLKCHVLALLALAGKRSPRVVWHLRDILTSAPPRLLLRAVHALSPAKPTIVANSAATASSFSRRLPCRVIHNGIDLAAPGALAPRRRPVVGIVGVLARWKGQPEFLEMARELNGRGLEAEYWIVGGQIYDTLGDQGYRASLEQRARELGLANVRFLGYRADMHAVYPELDVLVHASVKPEPFGRVLVEAQAHGVAVAASGAGGVLEIIENEFNGLLFPPGDVKAMADQVERLLENKGNLRERFRANARARLEERFSLEAHAERMKHVLAPGRAP